MTPEEISKLEDALEKVPAAGFEDGEAAAYEGKDDPKEKLVEVLTVGDKVLTFFREEPPRLCDIVEGFCLDASGGGCSAVRRHAASKEKIVP